MNSITSVTPVQLLHIENMRELQKEVRRREQKKKRQEYKRIQSLIVDALYSKIRSLLLLRMEKLIRLGTKGKSFSCWLPLRIWLPSEKRAFYVDLDHAEMCVDRFAEEFSNIQFEQFFVAEIGDEYDDIFDVPANWKHRSFSLIVTKNY
jgi:hypothetical protein